MTSEEVVQKSKETLHLARELAAQNKDEFIAEARQRLHERDQRFQEWEARSKPVAEDARAKWDREREEFLQHRSEMQRELDKLQDSSSDAWQDMKSGASRTWNSVTESFRKAAARIEKK